MAYYPDLTSYEYCWDGPLDARNVGWLSREFPFNQGKTTAEFCTKLRNFCLDKYLVRLFRGYHACEFCNVNDEQWAAESADRFGAEAHLAGIGCGEIRVAGETAVYAAPALILHYVLEHSYLPPEPFIHAVLHGPQPGSPDHEALLARWWHW